MAGYVTLFQGRVYEGLFRANQAMPNGIWVNKIANADDEYGFRVQPLPTGYTYTAGDEIYFLENEYDTNWDSASFSVPEYQCREGQKCRMHRVLAGEEVLMTVDQTLFDAATTIMGATFAPTALGTVVYSDAPGGTSAGPLRLVEKVDLWGMPALRLAAVTNV